MELNILTLVYLVASVTFILGLKMLSNPAAARKGNLIAAAGMTLAILATIATVNAPSLVADSAGLTLTGLLGVASITHWVWAGASILSTLLVVVAAFAADAATEQAGIAERVDALDSRRESGAQALAATSVTVNVGQSAAGATETGGRLSEGGHVATLDPSNTEIGVSALLVDGAKSSAEIARALGVSSSAVRMTDAWKNRVKEQA